MVCPVVTDLSDELLLEIGKLLLTSDLCTLTKVCSRFLTVFDTLLYLKPKPEALSTLATAPEDRFPLRDPHPAQFVRELTISFGRFTQSQTREQVHKALHNIRRYAPQNSLRSFALDCAFALPIGRHTALCRQQIFSSLTDLSIASAFPKQIQEESLAVMNSLLVPSLQRFKLTFIRLAIPPEYDFVCQLLASLPQKSPSLRHLDVVFPPFISDESTLLQTLWNRLVLPELKIFRIRYGGSYISLRSFFQRHPRIEDLSLQMQDSSSEIIAEPTFLLNIRHFGATLIPAMAACQKYGTNLETLHIYSLGMRRHDILSDLREALTCTPNLCSLLIDYTDLVPRHHFTSLVELVARCCPKITRFECDLKAGRAEIEQVYRKMLCEMRNLQYVKFRISKCHSNEALMKAHKQALLRLYALPIARDLTIELCSVWEGPSIWRCDISSLFSSNICTPAC